MDALAVALAAGAVLLVALSLVTRGLGSDPVSPHTASRTSGASITPSIVLIDLG